MERITPHGVFIDEELDISEEDRNKADTVISHLKHFPHITEEYSYIVDLTCNEIVYVSKGLCFLTGHNEDELLGELENLHDLLISEKDIKKIETLRIQMHNLVATHSKLVENTFCLRFNFHMRPNNKETLFHYQSVPFMRTKDGNIWMVLCTLSPSSRKDTGYATLHCNGDKKYFYYNFASGKFIEKELPCLTENEKTVILLSAQGHTEEQIAEVMCRSHNTIKTYKRNLFHKLQVGTISEGLMFCLNYNLL